MACVSSLLMILLTFICHYVESSEEVSAEKASAFFDAELYDKAIPHFKELLEAQSNTLLRYQLAQCYFLSENYDAAIALLTVPDASPAEIYILALAYAKKEQYSNAAETLQRYLDSGDRTFREEALCELGKSYFSCAEFSEARRLLAPLFSASDTHVRHISRVYLARTAMAEGKLAEAEKILNELSSLLTGDDPLHYELFFLLGELLFQRHEFEKAIVLFEKALPEYPTEHTPWHTETEYHLALCYGKMADKELSKEKQTCYFEKAEKHLLHLLEKHPEDRIVLALGQCYITHASLLQDESLYQKADSLLSRQDILTSREAQAQALLLRADATVSYATRDILYRNLTQEINRETPFFAKGWYLRGLNHFEEGLSLLSTGPLDQALQAFQEASYALKYAFELLKLKEPLSAGLALKYQALAVSYQDTPEKHEEALAILETFITQYPEILEKLNDPDEIYYLHSLISSKLFELEQEEHLARDVETSLRRSLDQYPNGKFADRCLLLLGTLYFKQSLYHKAEEAFTQLSITYPASPLIGEALFWAARCADGLQDPVKSQGYRQQVFEKYPESSYAPEAHFTYYSYSNYLQGDRAAVKHLQNLTEKYPNSPYAIHAWYLIGLDYKRDRKTPEGKWIRKRNLTAAIDAFQKAESVFNLLKSQSSLKKEEIDVLSMVSYRSTLERALTNLAIAEESMGAKRQIYLEYAEEVLQQILKNNKESTRIQEEASFWLAQAYIKSNRDIEADALLKEMLEKYRLAKITRGYLLSRAWYERGLIAMRRQEYELALQYLLSSEDSAKGKLLSSDQKLDLWIQQSQCTQFLGKMDECIMILSKAVNDDSVSALRIKAMYLRAEAYALEGRLEQARRQLESASKKGGEWSLKAKEKLVKEYGY